MFQLDGAPPHWGQFVRDCLDENFPNRWVGSDGPIPWPTRLPGITPYNFVSFWGLCKIGVTLIKSAE